MRLDQPDVVRAALEHHDLVPHRPHTGDDGATMRLRAAMARFTGDERHAERRQAVVDVIDHIDLGVLLDAARRATTAHLGPDRLDATEVARRVPTEAMATALGTEVDDTLADDVHAMVAVIGRGAAPSADTDAATERLLDRARRAGHDPVAVVSVLYQNTDATSALLLCRLGALALGAAPVPAVPRTRRVARAGVHVGAHRIVAGSDVTLELGAAGLPFGHGSHACPGEALATALVDAIVDTVIALGYVADSSSIALDDDGRPIALTLVAE